LDGLSKTYEVESMSFMMVVGQRKMLNNDAR